MKTLKNVIFSLFKNTNRCKANICLLPFGHSCTSNNECANNLDCLADGTCGCSGTVIYFYELKILNILKNVHYMT